ncbi:MAG: helix-turn-helix transcriptional regulator [Lachnospiraceae bacterium]|nr:helix-turn-helix transcriptional regulator [Lachnospiraceae bacterium]
MYEYLNGLSFPEKRNILLEMLLKNIGIGDLERSLAHLDRLLELLDELPSDGRFLELKLLVSELNVLLRHLSHSYKVHAHYSEELYQKFLQQTASCTLFSQLQKLITAMAKEYLFLIRDHSRRQYSNLIRECLDYIDFHYAEPITLAGLAERFCVSDSYLSSRFLQETGKNFVTYLNTVRIRYACTLLEKLQISMQKTAELCGFSSSNYFARVFHQQMGVSPTKYRKQVQKLV